jgi:ABC-type transporter Mla MlaB component
VEINPREDIKIIEEGNQLKTKLTESARDRLARQQIDEIDSQLERLPPAITQSDTTNLGVTQFQFTQALETGEGRLAISDALQDSGVPESRTPVYDFGTFLSRVDPDELEDVQDETGIQPYIAEVAQEEFREQKKERQNDPSQFLSEIDPSKIEDQQSIDSALDVGQQRLTVRRRLEDQAEQQIAEQNPGVTLRDVQANVDRAAFAEGDTEIETQIDEDARRAAAVQQFTRQSDFNSEDIAGVTETEGGFRPELTENAQTERIAQETEFNQDDIRDVRETDEGVIPVLTESAREREQIEQIAAETDFSESDISGVERTDSGGLLPVLTDSAREDEQIEALANQTQFTENEIVDVRELEDGKIAPVLAENVTSETSQSQQTTNAPTVESLLASGAAGAPIGVSVAAPEQRSDQEIAQTVASRNEQLSPDDVAVSDGNVLERVTAVNALDPQTQTNISVTDIQETDSGSFTLTERAARQERSERNELAEDAASDFADFGTENVGQQGTGQRTVSPSVNQEIFSGRTLTGDIEQFRTDVSTNPVVESTAEGVETVRDRVEDRLGPIVPAVDNAASTTVDVATSPEGQAAITLGTAAFPATPPVNPATLQAIRGGAAVAGGVAAAGLASEIDLPQQDQGELEIPSQSPATQSELNANENGLVSEIDVEPGEQQRIDAGELGVPEGQQSELNIVRGPDGAEITDDGEIIIPAQANQLVQQPEQQEEEDDLDDEDVGDEEIVVIEGPTGEDILDEAEQTTVSDETINREEIEGEEENIGEDFFQDIGEQTGEDAANQDATQPTEDFVEPETQPRFAEQQVIESPITRPTIGPGATGRQEDLLPGLIETNETETRLIEAQQPEETILDGIAPDIAPDQTQPAVSATQPALNFQSPTATAQATQPALAEQTQPLQELATPEEVFANPNETLTEEVAEETAVEEFGQPTRRNFGLPRPRFDTEEGSASGSETIFADEGGNQSPNDPLAPGWLSETVSDIATIGQRDPEPISRERLESARESQSAATGELPTAEFFDEESREQIGAVQDLFGLDDSEQEQEPFAVGLEPEESSGETNGGLLSFDGDFFGGGR